MHSLGIPNYSAQHWSLFAPSKCYRNASPHFCRIKMTTRIMRFQNSGSRLNPSEKPYKVRKSGRKLPVRQLSNVSPLVPLPCSHAHTFAHIQYTSISVKKRHWLSKGEGGRRCNRKVNSLWCQQRSQRSSLKTIRNSMQFQVTFVPTNQTYMYIFGSATC